MVSFIQKIAVITKKRETFFNNSKSISSVFTFLFFDLESFKTESKDQYSLIFFDFKLFEQIEFSEIEKMVLDFSPVPVVLLLDNDSDVYLGGKCLKYGYKDFLLLPCRDENIYNCIISNSIQCVHQEVKTPLDLILGYDSSMVELKQKILKLAQSKLNILFTGETGTGKSYIARIMHQLSPRQNALFLEENASAISENLFEGEMFGSVTGAYTGSVSRIGLFEKAHLGTLFLDEVSSLSLESQAKLLQALDTGRYRRVGENKTRIADVRLFAATNENDDFWEKGDKFRRDLFYRIKQGRIDVPPLRERMKDIHLLATHFMKEINMHKHLSSGAIQKLESYHWPGNLRELKNCLSYADTMSENSVISSADISFNF
jgi:transcriptional regulator with PAS, ATPase and Fis domain